MRKAAHIAIIEGNRMLMAVRADGTVGFIGGKQEPTEHTLTETVMREFREEMDMALPSRITTRMDHIMCAPVSKDLKCTLFACCRPDSSFIPHVMNFFKPNDEICGLIAVDISEDNRRNLMKMNLANGVKPQLEVLFKHIL